MAKAKKSKNKDSKKEFKLRPDDGDKASKIDMAMEAISKVKGEQKVKEVEFNSIRITLASPELIKNWSFGEVKKPETINYRTFKPEFEGLFCEKIFGPIKDYECACGKYKKQRYKGVVCDKCGVEVTEQRVRRERMGHIDLAVPVVHIWYLKGTPSKLSYLLGLSAKTLERVIYYENYIVINPGSLADQVKKYQTLNEDDYLNLKEKGNEETVMKIGTDAIKAMLKELELEKLAKELRKELAKTVSLQKKKDIIKRLKVVEAFRKSGNKPEWMIVEVLPVIPPELRPLVQLDGGRFVTSDLNDLYRRIINRNNRLKKLKSINSPELIIKNEKRMIQEAVDALFDNGRRGHPVRGSRNRPLKSLSEMLKGKQGRFRQNLLGKRVDYSGRSVIVVGPTLKLYQCGLPKKVAVELFKPFIMHKFQEIGYTIKSAKKMIENGRAEVWDILEDILDEHLVMLNRAPTLHRHSIQAFYPILVEGNALTLHPLVCGGFNADFDGDQLAVHVPLSYEAQLEAKFLMLATGNILSPASGRPTIVPNQDIVLGIYYMTKENRTRPDRKKSFFDKAEAIVAFNHDVIDIHEQVDVRMNGKKIETTAGRILFNDILPVDMEFVNIKMTKGKLSDLVLRIFFKYGSKVAAETLDKLKEIGFKYATMAGITIGVEDLIIPEEKKKMVEDAQKDSARIIKQYNDGVITETERYNVIIDKWTSVTDEVAKSMEKALEADQEGFNPLYMMVDSGARGSKLQIRQLAGMRGLMAKPQKKITGGVGEIIETPIISNFREGLTVQEYFISTHGARKGLADTALKTADAGYLTRRLVDVAQDVTINEEDCGTINGVRLKSLKEGDEVIELLSDRIVWRVASASIVDIITDEVIVKENELITPEMAKKIEKTGIEEIMVRSVLTCESKSGACAKCYGADLTTGKIVDIGEAVGIVAAQSIGEPGTQLTLRTFHVGGTASRIAMDPEFRIFHEGEIKFENINFVEKMNDKKEKVKIIIGNYGKIRILDANGMERDDEGYELQRGMELWVSEGDKIVFNKVERTINDYKEHDFIRILEVSLRVGREGEKNKIDLNAMMEKLKNEVKQDAFADYKKKHKNKDADKLELDFENEVKEGKIRISVRIKEVDKASRKFGAQIGIADPYNTIIVAEKKGTIRLEGFEEKKSRLNMEIEKGKKQKVQRRVEIVEKGEVLVSYKIPEGAIVEFKDGAEVMLGDTITKFHSEFAKTRDITGGLPRVAELFEARKPKLSAVISEISGKVTSIEETKTGIQKITVTNDDGTEKEYSIPSGKYNELVVNQMVEAGDELSGGDINPHDLLVAKGEGAVQEYLLNKVQEVYRLQGVGIHDKHIEVIVKQMLRKLRIEDPGDSSFLMDEQVDRLVFKKEKESLEKEGKVPPRARPQLLGITKAALSTESWISAASFQETTRILIDAAVNAKVDYLKGLKENVIIGHLISAGTGLNALKKYKTVARKKIARSRSKAEEQVEAALEEKEAEQE